MPDQTTNSISALEEQLIVQLSEIKLKLSDLLKEKDTLERILIDVRSKELKKTDVTRRNSINKIILENEILKNLKSKKMLTSKTLFKAIIIKFPDTNSNTFRTHLHRLKNKGLIISVNRGLWRLA